MAAVQGYAAIDATIATVQSHFPDFASRLVGPVDGHYHQCRFGLGARGLGAMTYVVGPGVARAIADNGAERERWTSLPKARPTP